MILGHALAIAINRFDHLYKEMRPPLGLTQLIILQAIGKNPWMKEEELPSIVGLEPESVRLVLHRIYKRKLFEKEGRGKLKRLHLTDAGVDALRRSEVLVARTQIEMLGEIPNPELFLSALSTLTAFPSQSPSSSV